MNIDFLACPNCGADFFASMNNGRSIVFHVSSHYVPIVLAMADDPTDDQVELDKIQCGACSWQGSARQLVSLIS